MKPKGSTEITKQELLQFINDINEGSPSEQLKTESLCLRAKQFKLRRNLPLIGRVQAEKFTRCMGEQFGNEGALEEAPVTFEADENWTAELEPAIGEAPTRQSQRSGGMFCRSPPSNPSSIAKLLASFLRSFGRVGTIPTTRSTIDLFLLHNKGGASAPSSYRPKALISHLRKLIEKVIDWRLRREYQFETEQHGIQRRKNTETGLLRASAGLRSGRRIVIVLDLTSAYKSVIHSFSCKGEQGTP